MKNVSLFKISAMVVSIAFASSFVNANDKLSSTMESAQTGVTDMTEMAKTAKEQSFPTLLEALDSDNNSMLSEAEVSVEHSQFLQEEFANIDANQDKNIDEEEFNNYFASIEEKSIEVAKRKI